MIRTAPTSSASDDRRDAVDHGRAARRLPTGSRVGALRRPVRARDAPVRRSRWSPGRRSRGTSVVGGLRHGRRPSAGRSPRGRCRATTVPTIRPSYITAIRSARANTSSSSVETMITAVPLSRSAMIRLWMNSIEPTSTPRVGCEAISTLSGAGQLPGDDDLLLVAARQRRRPASPWTGCGCRTPRSAASAFVAIAPRLSAMPLENSSRLVEVEDEVLAHGERADVPVVRAVLGDVADAVLEALPRAVLADVRAVEPDLAGGGLDQPEQRLDQLGLAVALDAGDAEDLAGPCASNDTSLTTRWPRGSITVRFLTSSTRLAGLGRRLVDASA